MRIIAAWCFTLNLTMNKSLSDPNIEQIGEYCTPISRYTHQRNKRSRPHDLEDEFNAFKSEIKDMITKLLAPQVEELKKITITQVKIAQTNANIENSIAFLAAKNEELEAKVKELEKRAKTDKEHIIMLEEKFEDLQRGYRKTTIELKNVPKNPKETKDHLMGMVTTLSKNIMCNIKRDDIRDIYRVQGKRDANTNTPIIVELSSTVQKAELLLMCRAFNIKNKEKLRTKHLGFTLNEEIPVYVSEQLTAKGARLFFVARDLAKTKGYKFCWTSYGRVYIRENESSPVILVKSEAQVQSLMLK